MPEAWIAIIRSWAATQPLILAVYVFGSRAKGHHCEDSDLDLALFLEGEDQGEMYGNWIGLAGQWRTQLTLALPVTVDLQFCDPEMDDIVWPAVQDHGVTLYRKGL
ncbi:MAG: nucleotidyltransferase domain-containing protein [Alphaproteobacteria bacterium]|nr:nucleotidyltransferase domain-containing protein [Alphaproteobacteria bacterium]